MAKFSPFIEKKSFQLSYLQEFINIQSENIQIRLSGANTYLYDETKNRLFEFSTKDDLTDEKVKDSLIAHYKALKS